MKSALAVLTIDDADHQTAEMIQAVRAGGRLVTAERVNSAEGLRAALAGRLWDVVLSEWQLAHLDGNLVLTLVRNSNVDLPVIFVSNGMNEEQAVSALKDGAYDFVRKDHLPRLVPVIDRALREAEERRVRRQAEQDLRDSEERYRELVENANDVVLTVDLQGNFTSLNAAGEHISGYRREQLRTMNMADVLVPESYQLALEMIRQKLQDDQPTIYELEIVAADGRRVPLEVSTRLLRHDGLPIGVQGIARDITERRLAREELLSRERKQAAVAQLGQHALAITDREALFNDAVRTVADTLGSEFVSILELQADGSTLQLCAGVGWNPDLIRNGSVGSGQESQAGYTLISSEPVIVDDLSTEQRFAVPAVLIDHQVTSGLSVIIHGEAQPFGVLSAFSSCRRAFSRDDVHFLQAVANVVATAVQRKRLEDERAEHNKEVATRVLQAQEEERKRIARELHDETAQYLSMLLTNLDLLEPHLPRDNPALREGFRRVGALAKRTLDGTRALSHDLRPTILDDAGLVAALEWLAAEYQQANGMPVVVQAAWDSDDRSTAELEVALFRIAQEALTNCGKHAHASSIVVQLGCSAGQAYLTVRDNGCGFDRRSVPGPTREGRLGLFGMAERATLLGGMLEVNTAPEHGTEILVRLPLPGTSADAASHRSAGRSPQE